MPLSQTLSRLKQGREAFAASFADGLPAASGGDRLSDLAGLSDNPGNLRGRCYVPKGLKRPAGLIVVLHGCTQNAGGYDQGSGWSQLADKHGFALLFPEQKRENNPNLCFNWYQDADARRGSGEAASIAAMVEAMKAAHSIDPQRVFVTGLSAGGAMAGTMLACYPDTFAGGAIIAGIPHGCASNLSGAFECMAGRGFGSASALAGAVRNASPHQGPWPRISIWHGSSDRTVVPGNADALTLQWAAVHGLDAAPSRTDTVDGYPRSVWTGSDGGVVMERFEVTGMAHGTPLMPGTGEGESGEARAHMLDVGLSSTDRIAAFFGLAPEPAARTSARAAKPRAPAAARRRPGKRPAALGVAGGVAGNVQKTIEDALRSAGLMK